MRLLTTPQYVHGFHATTTRLRERSRCLSGTLSLFIDDAVKSCTSARLLARNRRTFRRSAPLSPRIVSVNSGLKTSLPRPSTHFRVSVWIGSHSVNSDFSKISAFFLAGAPCGTSKPAHCQSVEHGRNASAVSVKMEPLYRRVQ